MPWTAPEVADPPTPRNADERATLEAWLDKQRATLLRKCTGLDADQLARQAAPPSDLSLLGLLGHATEVERTWFRILLLGEAVGPPFDVDTTTPRWYASVASRSARELYDGLVAEQDACRTAVAHLPLDATFDGPTTGPNSLRWIFVQVIQEYARHNGHADLLRQAIDGAVGE
ncbi:mycothiol transferase [Luteipulveratus halotolerans]|uniref:Mini-circle protein n=1 Tax=Luteipulveratus halotolerans TaxID=1631356 RepID=A0A0L6CPI9_9MICO|nr:DUF664 domain-containing protein [Luteipulveratus halotolerans]KNX39652.1 hypothetical protein VV01_21025 [Luteipulveratus halotolerans]